MDDDGARDDLAAPTPEQVASQIAFEARRLADSDELTASVQAEMRAHLDEVLERVAPEHAGPTLMLFLGARVCGPVSNASPPSRRHEPAPTSTAGG